MPKVTQHWRRDTATWSWAPDETWVTVPPYQLDSSIATSSVTRSPVASSNIKGGIPTTAISAAAGHHITSVTPVGSARPSARQEELRPRLFLEAKVRSRVGGGSAAWDWPGPERNQSVPVFSGQASPVQRAYCAQAEAEDIASAKPRPSRGSLCWRSCVGAKA